MNSFSDEVGALNLNGGTIAIGPTGTLTINGNITATGNSTITGGTLYIKEVTRTVNVAAGGTLTLDAAVTSIFNAGLNKTGRHADPGRVEHFYRPDHDQLGSFAVDGRLRPGTMTISSGAALTGSGSTGPLRCPAAATFNVIVNAGGSNMVSARAHQSEWRYAQCRAGHPAGR